MRTAEEIKSDIDAVCYHRDLILERLKEYDFNTVRRMADFASGTGRDERRCYAMVLHWIVSDGMKTVFLQDANTIAMKKDVLCDILRYLRKKIPTLEIVACYGRADALARLSAEDYKDLKAAGLTMIHSGYESGCDDVLKLLNKGTNRSQQIEAGKRIMDAGIEFNVFYMPGSGGKALSERNAIETADVINQINPDYVRIRTFVVKPGAPMWDIAQGPDFDECTDIEKVLEIRKMIEHLDPSLTSYVISDHIINLLPLLEGHVNTDKQKMLDYIDGFLALPRAAQKEYQTARRLWSNIDYSEMDLVDERYLQQVRDYIRRYETEEEWEELLRRQLRNYI